MRGQMQNILTYKRGEQAVSNKSQKVTQVSHHQT